MPYICNHTALDLGLEGNPDPSLDLLFEKVIEEENPPEYVCPEFSAAVDALPPPPPPPEPEPDPEPEAPVAGK